MITIRSTDVLYEETNENKLYDKFENSISHDQDELRKKITREQNEDHENEFL